MKLSGPGLLITESFLVAVSISLIAIVLFRFSNSSWVNFGGLCAFRNLYTFLGLFQSAGIIFVVMSYDVPVVLVIILFFSVFILFYVFWASFFFLYEST